jgi:hypothetical protein
MDWIVLEGLEFLRRVGLVAMIVLLAICKGDSEGDGWAG